MERKHILPRYFHPYPQEKEDRTMTGMQKYQKLLRAVYITCTLLSLLGVVLIGCNVVNAVSVNTERKRDVSADRVSDMPEIDIVEEDDTVYDTAATLPEFGYDFGYVMRVVGAECRGEPEDGIKAVCEVIANRCELYGMTPEEVVKQEGQFADPMPTEFYDGGELVNELCLLTFVCNEMWYDEPITAFKTQSCNSSWHKGLHYCFTIGNHEFYSYGG